MIKKIFKSDLSKEQKEHKKRIKGYSKQAYNIRTNITRFRPLGFEKSALQIANHLMTHKGAIVDFSAMTSDEYQRLIDFISGAVYCLGGSIDKLGDKLYLITPSSVNVKDDDQISEETIESLSKISHTSTGNDNKYEFQDVEEEDFDVDED